jgi:hypothetical protein
MGGSVEWGATEPRELVERGSALEIGNLEHKMGTESIILQIMNIHLGWESYQMNQPLLVF